MLVTQENEAVAQYRCSGALFRMQQFHQSAVAEFLGQFSEYHKLLSLNLAVTLFS